MCPSLRWTTPSNNRITLLSRKARCANGGLFALYGGRLRRSREPLLRRKRRSPCENGEPVALIEQPGAAFSSNHFGFFQFPLHLPCRIACRRKIISARQP